LRPRRTVPRINEWDEMRFPVRRSWFERHLAATDEPWGRTERSLLEAAKKSPSGCNPEGILSLSPGVAVIGYPGRFMSCHAQTPKGFYLSAQALPYSATLGDSCRVAPQPQRGCVSVPHITLIPIYVVLA